MITAVIEMNRGEIVPDIKHEAGVIAMAHAGSCQHDRRSGGKISGRCSNGLQFYITHRATPHLDGVHTVFGKVTSGKDVVNSIMQGDTMVRVIIE